MKLSDNDKTTRGKTKETLKRNPKKKPKQLQKQNCRYMRSPELLLYYSMLMSLLCFFTAIPRINSPDNMLQLKGNRNLFISYVVSAILIFWFGQRRLFLGGFVDTSNYAREYLSLQPGISVPNPTGEWVWTLIEQTCVTYGVGVQSFFTLVAAGYILSIIPAIKKFLPSDPNLGILIVFCSLFFVPFGVNGIRNGLACNLLLLAFAYLYQGKYPVAAVLSIICFGIHRSTMLPIATTLFTVFFFSEVKICIYFWVASIALSLVAGGWFINFFSTLGFDDRMAQYAEELDTDAFSQTGFRWDFLLYSAMPVYLCWYVCVKKRISDTWYNAIASTYLLCNAFWVLVIRASYSNRFAYLSWFLYPLVIAYPLVILPVWHNQDNRTGMILLAYIGFTIAMNFFWGAY